MSEHLVFDFWDGWHKEDCLNRIEILKKTSLKDLSFKNKLILPEDSKIDENYMILQTINSFFEDLSEFCFFKEQKTTREILTRVKKNIPIRCREDAGADFNLKQVHIMLDDELNKLSDYDD